MRSAWSLARIGAASRPGRSAGGRAPFRLGGGRADAVLLGFGLDLIGRRIDAAVRLGDGRGFGDRPFVVAAGDGFVDGQVLELAAGLLVGRLGLAHQVPQGDGLREVAALFVETSQGAVEGGAGLRLLPRLFQQPDRQIELAQAVGGGGHVHLGADVPRVAAPARARRIPGRRDSRGFSGPSWRAPWPARWSARPTWRREGCSCTWPFRCGAASDGR